MPKLQSVLSDALGGRALDRFPKFSKFGMKLLLRHLDGDEGVVMGAGLVTANLSTIFRLRRFGYLDGVIYPMQLQVLKFHHLGPRLSLSLVGVAHRELESSG